MSSGYERIHQMMAQVRVYLVIPVELGTQVAGMGHMYTP